MKIIFIYGFLMTLLFIIMNPTHLSAQFNTTSPTELRAFEVKQKLQSLMPLIKVEYQSESTIVLKAEEDILISINGTTAPFWEAIDSMKHYGYSLVDVTTSGMGSQGNPTRFYAIMTK
jgi:hypothetical protein